MTKFMLKQVLYCYKARDNYKSHNYHSTDMNVLWREMHNIKELQEKTNR